MISKIARTRSMWSVPDIYNPSHGYEANTKFRFKIIGDVDVELIRATISTNIAIHT